MPSRTLPRTLLALVLTAVAALGCWRLSEAVTAARFSAEVARAASASGSEVASTTVLHFRFRERTRFLTVNVSAAELRAARAVGTRNVFAQPPARRVATLRTLVAAESRAACVRETAGQLRAMRRELRLDDDEYVELMAAAVQAIPYGTPRRAFQLPAATLARGEGVCIDRSLLLAGLLLHEGYDAGLWLLPGRNHVAVALRGTTGGYRSSGYAFLEATEERFVGEVPERYARPGRPRPLLVRVRKGRRYHADAQTAVIVAERRRAERLADALRPYRDLAWRAEERPLARYEPEASRQMAAGALASQLRWCVHDREVAFQRIVRINGWSRGTGML